jgi:mitochondrial Rho GTPase 1
MPISVKLGDSNNIFRQIVKAAEHPHLNIPKTEGRKTLKQYHRLIDQSLMFVSGILFFRFTC